MAEFSAPAGNMPPFIKTIRSLMEGLPEFSDEVKTAFASLKETALSSGLERQQLREIKKAVIPTSFKAVSEAVAADSDKTEEPLHSEGIEIIIAALAPKLEESPATEDIATAVNNVIRAGLGDAGVMNVVRSAPLSQIAAKMEHMDATTMHHHEMRHGFEPGHGMPPFLKVMRKFFEGFPTYGEDFKSSIASLKETVSSAGIEEEKIRKLKKFVFPTIFKSVSAAIESDGTTEGPLSADGVESVTSAVKSKLEASPASEEISSAIVNVLTNGLNDSAVMDTVRTIPLKMIIEKMEKMDGHDIHAASLETTED